MTASNDLDRRLTDFLADGPSSATERSIVFALDHAAAHPRRRDVLSILRPDPMRSPVLAGPMRVLPLAAALALLVLAVAGAAFVGGVFNHAPVVVPPPIVSPGATVAPTPSASPIASPSPAVIHVDLVEHQGQDASIDVTDRSGDLQLAGSGDPSDGASVEEGKIQVVADSLDPTTLVVTARLGRGSSFDDPAVSDGKILVGIASPAESSVAGFEAALAAPAGAEVKTIA